MGVGIDGVSANLSSPACLVRAQSEKTHSNLSNVVGRGIGEFSRKIMSVVGSDVDLDQVML